MIDKINISQICKVTGYGNQNNKLVGAKKQGSNESNVEFSIEANMLQSIMSEPPQEVSPARLDAIKEAITNGEYKIDYDKLADTLLEQSGYSKG